MPNFQVIEFPMLAAETTTNWKRLSWTTPQTARMITGISATGDSIRIDTTLERLVSEMNIMETSAVAQTYASSSTYTANSFEFGYTGAPRWIRVVKTGTNGTARILIEG